MSETKICVSAKEVAKMIGITMPVMYKLVKVEDFPKVYVGKKIIIPIDGLKQWLSIHNGEQIFHKNDDKGEMVHE